MESFRTLFGSLLALVYHCFDRVVIQGYLPLLTRPEHIVHFFRDVHGIAPITKQVLAQRTTEYKQWVEAFARDHGVPIAWAEGGIKKEDHVRPYYARFARRRRVGVYFIFRSMEQGSKFQILPPKAADPTYRLIKRTRGRYTHFYFYIRDEVLGSFVMCVDAAPVVSTKFARVSASIRHRRRVSTVPGELSVA